MASIRKKLATNVNDSKNTRMDIAGAGVMANWRPDELAHISRFCKIGQIIMQEAKRLDRPVDCLESGCGEVWVLRYLYKAFVSKKAEIVNSYVGVDIDPACLDDWWVNDNLPVTDHKWFQTMTGNKGRIDIQDLTLEPDFKVEDESMDVFWTTEVIEHMKPECIEPWIKSAHDKLRQGGIAYVSTPNHDGSNDQLPKDHFYEWGFEELKTLLTKHFELVDVKGVFTQMNNFKKNHRANMRWSQQVVDDIEARFDKNWARVILATAYPETSNNCAWILRKK
tara:strand:+ start:2978 stop:3817 length:840 start_codon:yes stop_codon:yes gene_type:complete